MQSLDIKKNSIVKSCLIIGAIFFRLTIPVQRVAQPSVISDRLYGSPISINRFSAPRNREGCEARQVLRKARDPMTEFMDRHSKRIRGMRNGITGITAVFFEEKVYRILAGGHHPNSFSNASAATRRVLRKTKKNPAARLPCPVPVTFKIPSYRSFCGNAPTPGGRFYDSCPGDRQAVPSRFVGVHPVN